MATSTYLNEEYLKVELCKALFRLCFACSLVSKCKICSAKNIYFNGINFRNTAAEMRKRAIQESKFLGGDMEHTHLVKGLDFALLQKVTCVLCINLKQLYTRYNL